MGSAASPRAAGSHDRDLKPVASQTGPLLWCTLRIERRANLRGPAGGAHSSEKPGDPRNFIASVLGSDRPSEAEAWAPPPGPSSKTHGAFDSKSLGAAGFGGSGTDLRTTGRNSPGSRGVQGNWTLLAGP